MKLQVLQENLARALILASRFTSVKAQLPVLSNILISAKKTKLLISSTNLENSISFSLGAQIKEEGEITVPAKTITDLVSNLSFGPLNLESEKEHLKITAQKFSSRVSGMNPADFPSVPQSINKAESLILPKDEFIRALSQVIFSVSLDETRPILTGVLFVFQKDSLLLVATDGFRLSQKKIHLNKASKNQKIVLPKNILLEISRLGETDDEIYLQNREKENQALFGAGDVVFSSRVLEGEFPDYDKIIPKTSVFKIRLDKEDLLRAIKLSSVFARDSANIVKINLLKDAIKISSESTQSGSYETELDAKVEGFDSGLSKSFEIAFNFRFLEEFVRTVVGEEVALDFTDPSSPGVFTDPKDADYLHLIMPVKIQV